ncbi:MAG: 4Fe-4S binding protein [Deltaproteobacteria bacterium]|jgi:NAD-dependent dihydropyrimidine dehydrogenase PreA subunit|nr:4Fe-4S binding protein [Deltaproteobacteria bacterium]
MASFSVSVDALLCTGCGTCLEICPSGVFSPGEGGDAVRPECEEGCVGCLLCVESCPESCLRVEAKG